MALSVYLDLLSQPCRAVYLFLKLTGIDYKAENISLVAGDQRKPEYLAKFPLGKAPTIDDGGYTLSESSAILRYLASTRNVPNNWYPQEPKVRGRLEEYLAWHGENTRIKLTNYFIHLIVAPMRLNKPVNMDLVNKAKLEIPPILDRLDSYFLKDGHFIAGLHDISIGDLLAYCELRQAVYIKYDVASGRPHLTAWMDNLKTKLGEHGENSEIAMKGMFKSDHPVK